MPAQIHSGSEVAFWSVAADHPTKLVWDQPGAVPQYSGSPSNIRSTVRDAYQDLAGVTDAAPGTPPVGGNPPNAIMATQHTDFHFKLWILPPVLQLSNPQLDTDIPFRIWNTNPTPETVTGVLVNGSSVLTFDLVPGNVLTEFQYRQVNMQIGAGEPTIDATVLFNTTNLTGELKVLALVSDTFNLIPDVPIRETWEFQTDILTNYLGVEQRIALRRFPRIKQEFDFEIIDVRQRREQYNTLFKNIRVQSLVPLYQYAVNLDQTAPVGANRFYFNTAQTNMREGQFVAIVNPTTEGLFLSEIDTVHADGITTVSTSGDEMDGHWLAAPALTCLIGDGSGITMNNVTGKLKITADSFSEPALLRPNATRTIDMFDGLPWVNRRPLIPAQENMKFQRDVIDNQTGARDINSRHEHPRITGDRKFTIQRIHDPDEMDYWRDLFEQVRGAQKPFLLSTWFPDLTLVSGHASLEGVSEIEVQEGYYDALYAKYNTYNHIQIEYPDGTTTQHIVTNTTSNESGSCSISFTPVVPNDPSKAQPKYISFLQRWRATDRVVFRHYANYSEVSFGVISSDE